MNADHTALVSTYETCLITDLSIHVPVHHDQSYETIALALPKVAIAGILENIMKFPYTVDGGGHALFLFALSQFTLNKLFFSL